MIHDLDRCRCGNCPQTSIRRIALGVVGSLIALLVAAYVLAPIIREIGA